MKLISYVVAVVVIIVSICFFSWYVKRQVNYNLGYKSMVEQTIKDMVKPEALKSATDNSRK
jgi:predicted RND superfamily exporter protein